MRRTLTAAAGLAAVAVLTLATAGRGEDRKADGFVSLFNGKDLTGWKVPPGDNGHWKVVDGVIDCDARSESKVADKSMWSEKKFKDFVLTLEWRFKTDEPGYMNPRVEVIKPDGSFSEHTTLEDVDSGVYVRGSSKAQVNMWMWPIGSGEVYGYRKDAKLPTEIHAGVTPKKRADKPRGEWNTFEITMKGDRLTVNLNGEEVISNAQLPGVPEEGPIALQHHGSFKKTADGKVQWTSPPSLVQFRNVRIKELK
jgi:hypothetical protein